MADDVIDEMGTNATASFLLNDHHEVVGERDREGELENCERCGFAAGWVQPTALGPDQWGHATACTSDDVRTWIAANGDGPKLPRSDDAVALLTGKAVTTCCGAFVTFHDETLCCKGCWREID